MSKEKWMVQVRHYAEPLKYGRVLACEHKFSPNNPPKNNCKYCWEAYFKLVADLTSLHDELLKGGKKALEIQYGTKFARQFDLFLTIELMKEKENGEPVQSDFQ